MSVQQDYAGYERYSVGDTKTKVMYLKTPRDYLDIPCSTLNGKVLGKAIEQNHICVLSCSDVRTANTSLIENRITCVRRTAYALMGAGFHGCNGLNS